MNARMPRGAAELAKLSNQQLVTELVGMAIMQCESDCTEALRELEQETLRRLEKKKAMKGLFE